DPPSLVVAAIYSGQLLQPQVLRASANYLSPVPGTTNFLLTVQFDRTMNRSVEPKVMIKNSDPAKAQPVVPSGGSWSQSVLANDTYGTAPITFTPAMNGTNSVTVSGAADPAAHTIESANVLSFVVDATPPAIRGIAAGPSLVSAEIDWTTDK